MLVSAIVLGIICGLLFKKDIRTLSQLPVRAIYLPVLAFGIQFLLDFLAARQYSWLQDWWGVIHSGSYLFLFWWVYLNRNLPGMWWIGGGTLLNFLAIIANRGFMPVHPGPLPEEVRMTLLKGFNGTHRLLRADSVLDFLADIIYLPWPFRELNSIGDVLLAAGAGWLIFRGMQKSTRPVGTYHP